MYVHRVFRNRLLSVFSPKAKPRLEAVLLQRFIIYHSACTFPPSGHLVRMSLSGHHITFRLRPSSRSFLTFMITTGGSAFAAPLPSPSPVAAASADSGSAAFSANASISVVYGAQRLHLFQGPKQMQFIKWRIWWDVPASACSSPSRVKWLPLCVTKWQRHVWRGLAATSGGIDWGLRGLSRPYAVLFCAFVQCQKCICQSLLSPFDT